jgi:hypothetical protein
MKTIEEQIWDYIDGNLTIEEKLAIETKIATDLTYSSIYKELSAVNLHLNAMETDMPPMAFNRNVMDRVAKEIAPVSLKTKVNQWIIYGIAAFFIFTLSAILIFAISQTNFSGSNIKLPEMNIDFTRYFGPAFIKIFLFTDLLLGFIYLDVFLRRKKI